MGKKPAQQSGHTKSPDGSVEERNRSRRDNAVESVTAESLPDKRRSSRSHEEGSADERGRSTDEGNSRQSGGQYDRS